MEKFDLDKVLVSVNGWGKFQKIYYLSLCSVVVFSVMPINFIFNARDIKYRCEIENCPEENGDYNPSWLQNAVPFKNDIPSRCNYYKPKRNDTCTDFDRNSTQTCSKFIFERNQTTIVHDFGLTCDENLWKLTTVGTINVLGELFCLPIAGYLSDKFGRKSMVIISVMFASIFGLVKSLADSYYTYIILEFIERVLDSGMYSGGFILAIEIVDSKRRNMGNTIICCAFTLGQVLLATASYFTTSWRTFLRVIYTPGILVVISLWFTPESLRWLLSKHKISQALDILKTVARVNKTQLEEDALKKILNENVREEKTEESSANLLQIFKSKKLLLRTLHCSFTWICCNFPYYGLTIQSVALSTNLYLNFICTSLVEVPAYLLTYGALDRFGRRKSLGFSLVLAAIACISINFAGKESWISLVVFLTGKFFITMAYATIYIYTAEMFPTNARHSTFAICSMCGRFGMMLATQVPLLARLYSSLPMIVFSILALAAGFLAFLFPETHNIQLPDRINEAIKINDETL